MSNSGMFNAFENFGSGGLAPAAASGAAAATIAALTVVGSDDPTGNTAALDGQTLDNGLGGSGTRTWGGLIGTGSGITYGSNVITVVNNGSWRATTPTTGLRGKALTNEKVIMARQAEAQMAADKQAALAKLTAKEREALGV